MRDGLTDMIEFLNYLFWARSDGEIKFFKNLFGGFNHSPRRQKCIYQQEIHR